MMLIPDAPAPGRMNPVNGLASRRRERRKLPGRRIEEEHVARAHFDRQRATVEASLERLDLERDAVVVDPVAAVHARATAPRGPVETDARSEVVQVLLPLALQERLHQRVDLVHAADVLDVGVELVAQAEVEREVRPDTPVVLHEDRDVVVVGVVDDERLVGLAAPQRHREEQIAVVDAAVTVVIEAGEVFDELDPAFAKHAEIEPAVHVLPLAARAHRVAPRTNVSGVGELEPLLGRPLRNAKGRCRPGCSEM